MEKDHPHPQQNLQSLEKVTLINLHIVLGPGVIVT